MKGVGHCAEFLSGRAEWTAAGKKSDEVRGWLVVIRRMRVGICLPVDLDRVAAIKLARSKFGTYSLGNRVFVAID